MRLLIGTSYTVLANIHVDAAPYYGFGPEAAGGSIINMSWIASSVKGVPGRCA